MQRYHRSYARDRSGRSLNLAEDQEPAPPATNPYVEKVKGALDEELRADRVRIQVRTGNAP
jgi:hypothetical protein